MNAPLANLTSSEPVPRVQAAWWQESVIYEVLVPSFLDTNGDGWGDLNGITQKLDYLVDLGIGVLWLSPIFQSPMFDLGYDVSDFCAVNPLFGTLEDYQRLLDAAHARDLRIIIDFIPNHTSNEHAWFKQSRQSKDNPYRDFYLWHDPAADSGPPNNWINRFGLSAWTFDEHTGQYYFGTFAPEQPDLNWRNPAVLEAMAENMRFWLRLGTDGFRIDALPHLVKDSRLRNNPRDPDFTSDSDLSDRLFPVYSQNQPELLDLIAQFKGVISQFPDRAMICEVFQPAEQINSYQRAGADLLLDSAMFQDKFDPLHLQMHIDHAEATTAPGAWPAHMSGDHDLDRLGSRLNSSDLRLAALLQMTLRGTPAMYYGEELGLAGGAISRDQMVDPSGRHMPKHSRDPLRLPMPWTNGRQAGFTTGEPWLPIDEATRRRNVRDQLADSNSLLNFYRQLLALRRREPLLLAGDYRPLDGPEGVLVYERYEHQRPNRRKLLVAINFNHRGVSWTVKAGKVDTLLSIAGSAIDPDEGQLTLLPRDGLVISVVQ